MRLAICELGKSVKSGNFPGNLRAVENDGSYHCEFLPQFLRVLSRRAPRTNTNFPKRPRPTTTQQRSERAQLSLSISCAPPRTGTHQHSTSARIMDDATSAWPRRRRQSACWNPHKRKREMNFHGNFPEICEQVSRNAFRKYVCERNLREGPISK